MTTTHHTAELPDGHIHGAWFTLAADILRPTGNDPDGERAPAPQPDQRPQPIAA